MGSNEEEARDSETIIAQERISQKHLRRSIVYCLWAFLISITGGFILVWWEIEYHKSNTQLWMVPFGLIMLATPIIVWLSILFSNICNCEPRPPAAGGGDAA